ncbi:hypothetical protein [Flavobacterium aurantiibacter]|nr:hypothetical protein [Flavobacterium aurantiibacter]
MKKIVVNREVVISSVAKMVADKSAVRSFLKGQTSIETLTRKGIKFAKPV